MGAEGPSATRTRVALAALAMSSAAAVAVYIVARISLPAAVVALAAPAGAAWWWTWRRLPPAARAELARRCRAGAALPGGRRRRGRRRGRLQPGPVGAGGGVRPVGRPMVIGVSQDSGPQPSVEYTDRTALRELVRSMVGRPAWSPALGIGSYLTLEVGAPAGAHGEYHVWLYCTAWRLDRGGELLCGSEDDRGDISKAIAVLERWRPPTCPMPRS